MRPVLHRLINGLFFVLTPLIARIARRQATLGPSSVPATFKVWSSVGLTPVLHHYYQPIYDPHDLPLTTWTRRDPLHGINMNAAGQVALLEQFHYGSELTSIPMDNPGKELKFYYDNGYFGSGDAEILYNMIRHFQPRQVMEIGSGHSTRMAKKALDENWKQGSSATHICIEPYTNRWLEDLGVGRVIRSRVEDVDPTMFRNLQENDILFIDSSHVLRTGGDVFTEYLHILPILNAGVIIHVHDIFLPFDYPEDWVVNWRRFYTEQYLLQAFLAFNDSFEILAALNYLAHDYRQELGLACPVFARHAGSNPSSFWIRKKL